MTRKHFILIANTINASRPSEHDCDAGLLNHQIDTVAKNMADEFEYAHVNPNFDRARFLTACGISLDTLSHAR